MMRKRGTRKRRNYKDADLIRKYGESERGKVSIY